MNGEMRKFWDQAHEEKRILSLSGHPWATILEGLGLYDVDFKDRTVLEIGVGMGHLTKYLADHGAMVHALDISPVALARVSPWASWSYLDNELDLMPADYFDYAISFCVIQHMDDDGLSDQLHHVYRALKKDGEFRFQFSFPYQGPPYPTNEFTMQCGSVNRSLQKISDMVTEAGGVAVGFFELGTYPEHKSGWSVAYTRRRK